MSKSGTANRFRAFKKRKKRGSVENKGLSERQVRSRHVFEFLIGLHFSLSADHLHNTKRSLKIACSVYGPMVDSALGKEAKRSEQDECQRRPLDIESRLQKTHDVRRAVYQSPITMPYSGGWLRM